MLRLLRLLKPSPVELEQFALLETDPEQYRRFEPITGGPLQAFGALCFVAAAAIVVVPLRLISRTIGGSGR
jgi:hypothetical protein